MTAQLRNSTAVVILSLVLVGLLTSTVGASAASPHPPRWVLRGPYAPTIDPADFVAKVDNPFFPLVPGTAFHFRGVSDTSAQTRGNPRPGAVYRQEYYRPAGALDQARVLGRTGSLRVPAGTYRRPLATIEWSPVEPQLEKKWYVAGVGEIMEQVVAGGHEQFQLIKVTR